MKLKHYLIFTIITIAVSLATVVLTNSLTTGQSQYKTAHIKLGDVYEDFELKKQLEVKLTKVENARKNILDSLEFQLKSLQIKITETKEKDASLIKMFQLNRDNYLKTSQQFEEDNQRMSEEYNKQIWDRLNQYIKDYGKANNYTYVFGADGSGAIMYGSEGVDITEEIIKYTNDKFKGK